MAVEGLDNKIITERVSFPRPIVSRWRNRFFEKRMAGSPDKGRQLLLWFFLPASWYKVEALACELPCRQGIRVFHLNNWVITTEAVRRSIVAYQ